MGFCKLQVAADSFEKPKVADLQDMKRCRVEKPLYASSMQASQQHRTSNMFNTLCYKHLQKLESQPLNQHRTGHCNASDNNGYPVHISHSRYCTLESSSLSSNHTLRNCSPSLVSDASLTQQESLVRCSPETRYSSPAFSGSCVTEDVNDLKIKLKELETAMMGPDLDFTEAYDNTFSGNASSADVESWRQMMEAAPGGDLRQLLVACAKAVSSNDLIMAHWLMSELRQLVSVYGEPMQRLGAYMLEGLVAKLTASGSSIYKSLEFREPASFELLSYMHILYEVCPYFKFGYMSANGAIAEAMKDEVSVHIIDFQISQGSQWIPLIQAFAARPGGPPHIRITGIDDRTSAYARGGGLSIVAQRLSKLAKIFKVPFEFNSAAMTGPEVAQLGNIEIRPGEALAVNFAFMLHRVPDESVSTENHRDSLLRTVKRLNPKVVTLVEQELNTNTAAFYPRFLEAVDYYTAMFESIDATLPRQHKERINVEQHCLARDVVNIIACEGTERVERHELLGKWRSRLEMAGFKPYPLSALVNATIKTLLGSYCDKYRLEERDGALFLGWLNRDLVASSAWK